MCDKLNDHEKEQLRKHKKEGKLYVIVLWVMKKKRLKKMIKKKKKKETKKDRQTF